MQVQLEVNVRVPVQKGGADGVGAPRVRHAGRVAEAHLPDPVLLVDLHDGQDLFRRDLPVPGGAEGHLDRADHLDSRLGGQGKALFKGRDALLRGPVVVPQVVGGAGGDPDLHAPAAACQCVLQPSVIGNQGAEVHIVPVQGRSPFEQLPAVRHLGHPVGPHEGPDLHRLEAGIQDVAQKLKLLVCADAGALVLKAVSQAHLCQDDC